MNPRDGFPEQAGEGGRLIGALLVAAGSLTAQGAEAALRLQQQTGMRFGDAARALGLVSEAALQAALSRQFDYPCLQHGASPVSAEVVAAFDPHGAQVEALRALRTRLMLGWFDRQGGRRTLAVASAERGDGRSWMAANLAVVFAQLGLSTLLIDADLRHPRQHALFGLSTRAGLSTLLAGRGADDAVCALPGLPQLAVLGAGPPPPNPQELLARPWFAQLLESYAQRYQVVLLDSTAATGAADGQTVAARAGGALLLARRDQTRTGKFRACAAALDAAGATLAGTVLCSH
ncbi:MAG: chain length determinant protein tyrosine kinase EpsG [Rhodocyclaceae bacterium]|nr:chain length determinant protein tyrosine kinase EpsG [Rhodocyclaceae bacterium]